jgi:hypothetical protein
MNRLLKRSLLPVALVAGVLTAHTQAANAVPAFGTPVVVSGKEASEPGIDIAANGTIYVNAPGGVGVNSEGVNPSYLWRSTNGGASFTETSDLTRMAGPGGGDSDLVVVPDTQHLAFTDLWLGSASVSSDVLDQGDTWVTNPLEGVVAQDRQWLAATNGDVVYHVTNQLPGGLVVSKSFNAGATYVQHTVAASVADRGFCVCSPGNLIAESGNGPLGDGTLSTYNDKVGVIFATQDGDPTGAVFTGSPEGVSFAKSTNGGLTWTIHQIVAPAAVTRQGIFPVVANAGGNLLVATWYENGKIAVSRSTNWGDSWSATAYVSGSDSAVMPWVDARGSKVSIAYYGKVGSDWFLRYTESVDGGLTYSAPVTADSTRVKHNAPCLNGTGCGGDRELGDFLQVVIDGNGKANISYVRSTESQYVVPTGVVVGFLYTDTEIRYVRQS